MGEKELMTRLKNYKPSVTMTTFAVTPNQFYEPLPRSAYTYF